MAESISLMFLLISFAVFCDGIIFNVPGNKVPTAKRDFTQSKELRRLFQPFDTDNIQDVIRFREDDDAVSGSNGIIQTRLSYKNGGNCGVAENPIIVHDLEISDTVIGAGEKIIVAADVEVKRDVEVLSLLSVTVQKVGASKPVPCVGGMWGSCNFTNPCALLQSATCPNEILDEGWDCQCPLTAHQYSFAPMIHLLPATSPVPGWLMKGTYNVEVKLFEGINEVMCYHVQMQVMQGK